MTCEPEYEAWNEAQNRFAELDNRLRNLLLGDREEGGSLSLPESRRRHAPGAPREALDKLELERDQAYGEKSKAERAYREARSRHQ
jgi:hypothetical protein